jgi:hypothetical protein
MKVRRTVLVSELRPSELGTMRKLGLSVRTGNTTQGGVHLVVYCVQEQLFNCYGCYGCAIKGESFFY